MNAELRADVPELWANSERCGIVSERCIDCAGIYWTVHTSVHLSVRHGIR